MKRVLQIAILIGALLSGNVNGDEIYHSKNVSGRIYEINSSEEANSRVSDKKEPNNNGIDDKEVLNESNLFEELAVKYHLHEIDVQKKYDEINSTSNIYEDVKNKPLDEKKLTKTVINSNSGIEDNNYKSVNDETNSIIVNKQQVIEHKKAQTIQKETTERTKAETENEILKKSDKLSQRDKKIINEDSDIHINEIEATPDVVEENDMGSLSSTTFSTVNHYCCMAEEINDKEQILYGTKAWSFSLQDVNFTLSYPTAEPIPQSSSNSSDEFIITGFKLILYIVGAETRGYITNGGVLQDKITLTFINSGISSLYYQFWLYGTPKHLANMELNKLSYLCTD